MKMKLPPQIAAIIAKLDEKKVTRAVYASLIAVGIILGIATFFFVRKVMHLKREMKKVNVLRRDTQHLLMRDAEIKEQRAEVEKILAKDKKFRLIKFEQELFDKFKLNRHKPESRTTIKQLENLRAQGYEEELRTISLKGLNMRQVVEILDAIDKNERVFTRKVELVKSASGPTIDMTFVMGTLNVKKQDAGEGF